MKYFIAATFRVQRIGTNCPKAATIIYSATCVKALQSLGKILDNLNVNRNDRPAGCYRIKNGKGFYNSIVDPSLTDPSKFGNRGGICMKTGKNGLRIW